MPTPGQTPEHLRLSYLALKAVSQGVLISGPDRKIKFVNKAFCDITGYNPEEIIGNNCNFLHGPLTEDKTIKKIRHALDHRREFSGEILNYKKDGTPFWNDLTISPALDDDGELTHFIGVTRDVTPRIKAEENAERAWREVENQKYALDQHAIVATTDLDGVITYVNDKFCNISGYSQDELIGQTHRLVNSGTHPKRFFNKLWHTILEGKVWTGDICNRAKNGSLYWVRSTLVPLLNNEGKPKSFIAIRTSITMTKLSEARLAQAKDHAENLNRELNIRIAEANELTQKAERANEIKSVFVANMSHEIRTPISSIMGMLELVSATEMNAEQRDYILTAYRSTQGLLSIINDILDFSKLEANRIDLENKAFDIYDIIFDIAELFRLQITEHNLEILVHIAPDAPKIAIGDAGRLRQIVSNLIGNAVKFTQKGHVLISLRYQHDAYVIEIVDTGIGIPAHRINALFTPFTQVDTSTTRKFGGSGLGLIISRRLATLMKGTLTVASEEWVGSTFTLKLPLAIQREIEPEIMDSLVGQHILILDQHPISRHILKEQVEQLGARAFECADKAKVVSVINDAYDKCDPFSAALISVNDFEADGASLGYVIRNNKLSEELPIIMLTASALFGAAEKIEQHGYNGHLIKPVRKEALSFVLVQAIAHNSSGIAEFSTWFNANNSPNTLFRDAKTSDIDVLLAEDNQVNQKMGTTILQKLGARVSVAVNGFEAIAMSGKNHYDLILMDCQMPDMDGYTATKIIRRREAGTDVHVPIIALTASAMTGSRDECLAAGMDDYVAKPIMAHQFYQILHRWVEQPKSMANIPQHLSNEIIHVEPKHSELREEDPLFDPHHLAEVERLDPGMAHIILKSFRNDLKTNLVLLEAAIKEHDSEKIKKLAHKLKGASGSIGAISLNKLARELELFAKDGDRDYCQNLRRMLEKTAENFFIDIRPDNLIQLLESTKEEK